MNNAIRLASSAACVFVLLLGCEREASVLGLQTHRLAWAAALTSAAGDGW